MTDPTDNEKEAERHKKKGEGEGEPIDVSGREFVSGGNTTERVNNRHLPPLKLKAVMADWRHLDVNAVAQAVAEFFAELPMRASANLSVFWEKTKRFALVNDMIKFGEKAANDLKLTRERVRTKGRDTKGFQNKREQKVNPRMGMNLGPTGPTGQ
jgi:hypothetical protein